MGANESNDLFPPVYLRHLLFSGFTREQENGANAIYGYDYIFYAQKYLGSLMVFQVLTKIPLWILVSIVE